MLTLSNSITLICVLCLIIKLASLNIVNYDDYESPPPYYYKYYHSNEILTSYRLFDTINRRFNATDYFNDFQTCWNDKKLLHCMKRVNAYHRDLSRLWKPSLSPWNGKKVISENKHYAGNQSLDCSYSFNLLRVDVTFTHYQFWLSILQSNCSQLPHIPGGTTFQSTAYSSAQLVDCSLMDHFNNTYTVRCVFSRGTFAVASNHLQSSRTNSNGVIHYCINLTVIVDYEHYDGYSEVLMDWSSNYPSLVAIISDNEVYCSDRIILNSDHIEGAFDDTANKVSDDDDGGGLARIPDNIYWYSGQWINKHGSAINHSKPQLQHYSSAYTNFHYNFIPNTSFSSYCHHYELYGAQHKHKNYFPVPSIYKLSRPGDWNSFSDSYEFDHTLLLHGNRHPEVAQPTDDSATLHTRMNNTAERLFSDCVKHNLSRHVCMHEIMSMNRGSVVGPHSDIEVIYNISHPYTRALNEVIPNATAAVAPTKSIHHHKQQEGRALSHEDQSRSGGMLYYFIGSSHMRYLYDSVIEYYHTRNATEGIPRKHDHIKFNNMNYDFISNTNAQTHHIPKLCNTLQKSVLNNVTIIFQTGAWDLSMAPLIRLIRDSTAGPLLMSVFSDIFNETLKCGNLKHVVWLTSMAYFTCMDKKSKCLENRSYRTNTAIAAGNQFFLAALFKIYRNHLIRQKATEEGDRIQLSIVDAFHIIKPRLLLDDRNEVTCTNHFSCRVYNPWYSSSKGSSKHSDDTVERDLMLLIHTPAGAAIVKALMYALSMYELKHS